MGYPYGFESKTPFTDAKNKKPPSHICKGGNGSATVRISNKFIADLKRIAELDTKMTEYDELGRLMKSRKEREKLIPKVVDKKKKIRAKRKARKVALKKWIINITD